jgi:hypothetical protein
MLYIYSHTCTYTHIYPLYVCIYLCIYVCIYTHIHTFMYTICAWFMWLGNCSLRFWWVSNGMHIAYTHTHILLRKTHSGSRISNPALYMCTCMLVDVCICVCVCVCVCVYKAGFDLGGYMSFHNIKLAIYMLYISSICHTFTWCVQVDAHTHTHIHALWDFHELPPQCTHTHTHTYTVYK